MNRFAAWRYSRVLYVLDVALVVENVVQGIHAHDPAFFVIAVWVLLALQLTGMVQVAREQRDAYRKAYVEAVEARLATLTRLVRKESAS
jgi:hypothetical protein